MDGKVFKVSEKEIGVNAPPVHPRCRTTTVAYFPDDIDEERIATDSKGKVYYVDENMDYKEWYDKYVRSNPKDELTDEEIEEASNMICESIEKYNKM